jgi:hypothetical protein
VKRKQAIISYQNTLFLFGYKIYVENNKNAISLIKSATYTWKVYSLLMKFDVFAALMMSAYGFHLLT